MADSATPPNASAYPRRFTAGGVTLTRTPDQLYLEFSAAAHREEIAGLLARHRLRPVRDAPAASPGRSPDSTEGPRGLWVRSTGNEDVPTLVAVLRGEGLVRIANPVYHRADLLPAVTGASFADRLLVRFAPRAAGPDVAALIEDLGTGVVASAPHPEEGDLFQLQLRSTETRNAFAVAEEFERSPLVRSAGPDWIQLHPATSATTPNDGHFAQQWNLDRIGAPGAWDISQGDSAVVIAVIDTGCDLTHPDLSAKYVPQADRRDVINGTDTPDDVRGHGTLVAGVAAAETNNARGVAGVGWNCSIMPILLIDANDTIRSELDIVNAVDWARTHGAHVANMSWHWDLPHANAETALENAHAAGVVLVAASGNCFPNEGCASPGSVDFPASHRRVIAVGASNRDDRRKQPATGETRPWHSRYGAELSVVAPGTIPWTSSDGGGYGDFWGTSAAAPHVAGLAGLLVALLRKPVNIPPWFQTNDLVWNIIEQTAAKVGGYAYAPAAGHPNGTWHEEMGYGRINAAEALRYARDAYTTYPLERPGWAYAVSVQILLGLTGGGAGVVLPHGSGPVPVDPGWNALAPEKRDVLLGLAVTQLAEGVADPQARRALLLAGKEAIERAAQRLGPG